MLPPSSRRELAWGGGRFAKAPEVSGQRPNAHLLPASLGHLMGDAESPSGRLKHEDALNTRHRCG